MDISFSQGYYGYYLLGFQPKQQYVKIWPTPFQNGDPINAKLENTGKCLGELQPTYPLHSIVYQISEAKSSTPFICWCDLIKTDDGEWMLWMMVNEFYDVVTMKMKFNWKYDWTLSFMETNNYKSQQENHHKIQLS